MSGAVAWLGSFVLAWTMILPLASGADVEALGERELRKRSAANDLEAAVELGFRMYGGTTESFDGDFMFKRFTEAAETGMARGEAGLSICYRRGIGTRIDLPKSLEHAKSAADKGDPDGLFQQGQIEYFGYLPGMNRLDGLEHLKMAAGKGQDDAIVMLERFKLDRKIPQDRSEAQSLATLDEYAKDRKNGFAAHLIGEYHKNRGSSKSAKDYFNRAVELNFPAAMIELAEQSNYKGKKAVSLLRQAAARGSLKGKVWLSKALQRDAGGRLEGENWIKYAYEAKEAGEIDADLYLGQLYKHASGYEFRDLDWSKSARWLENYRKHFAEISGPRNSKSDFAAHYLMEIFFDGGFGQERDFTKCLGVAEPLLGYCEQAPLYAGRMLLHPDSPLGNTREHYIRGYACMLDANERGAEVSANTLYLMSSRHSMSQAEIGKAEALQKSGFPNSRTPILP